MVEFSFKGRYTLRGINGEWFIYDRETQTTTLKAGNTFKSAERYLNNYKKEKGDL